MRPTGGSQPSATAAEHMWRSLQDAPFTPPVGKLNQIGELHPAATISVLAKPFCCHQPAAQAAEPVGLAQRLYPVHSTRNAAHVCTAPASK